MLHRLCLSAAAALVLTLAPAMAQEKPAAAETKQEQSESGIETKTLLHNEQIRVMEMRFKPGAKTTSVSHPNRFIYALTDGALVFSPPGKTPYELSFKRGEALWLPADETATQNDTDQEVRTLVVEIESRPPAVAGKESGKSRRAVKRHGKKPGRKTASQ